MCSLDKRMERVKRGLNRRHFSRSYYIFARALFLDRPLCRTRDVTLALCPRLFLVACRINDRATIFRAYRYVIMRIFCHFVVAFPYSLYICVRATFFAFFLTAPVEWHAYCSRRRGLSHMKSLKRIVCNIDAKLITVPNFYYHAGLFLNNIHSSYNIFSYFFNQQYCST